MFQKKHKIMAKNNLSETKPNTIVSGTVIKGEIVTDGDFRIDGTLVGSISSKGKIVIGQSGSIEGEIICQNADISGKIKAKVKVEQLITLKSSAQLNGDVTTDKLAIEPGAKFTGSCNMDSRGPKNQNITPTNEKERPKEKLFK
ncbi:MAG: polymer-forming cytoskeletal protein [Bacteroidetes bacterium]|nr:polymer-forming cytoskeletal protein [Bacteroidota bacterium]MBL7104659.1 polymer-forming cytoskeletal protein [Bacteroidales bacterium]